MTRFLTTAAAVCLSLSTALPAQAEIDPAKALSVIGMFRAYGCTLNTAQVDLFWDEMGVTEAEYAEILQDAIDRGFATGDAATHGAVTLNDNFCTLQHAENGTELLVEVLRYHDCRLEAAQIPVLILPLGYMRDTLSPAVQGGIADGRIVPESQTVLTLSEAACHPEM